MKAAQVKRFWRKFTATFSLDILTNNFSMKLNLYLYLINTLPCINLLNMTYASQYIELIEVYVI